MKPSCIKKQIHLIDIFSQINTCNSDSFDDWQKIVQLWGRTSAPLKFGTPWQNFGRKKNTVHTCRTEQMTNILQNKQKFAYSASGSVDRLRRTRLVCISRNFCLERHFPKFQEKRATWWGVSKFSEICDQECSFYLNFRKFWLNSPRFGISTIFRFLRNFPRKFHTMLPFMSRIERTYCLISTSYLAGLFNLFILHHIWQNCVCFSDFLPMRTLGDV